MSEIKIQLRGAFPHQQAFLDCPKRYAIAASGTKAGKSVAGAMYAIRALLKRPGVCGSWVAPTYEQAISVGLETVRGLLPPEHVKVRLSGVPSLTIGNSTLEFKSAEQPDHLFGPARAFAVLDEASRISEEAFDAVASTLVPSAGPMRLLSNPGARTGWFYRLWCRGRADDPDVAAFSWKTADNPTIDPSVISGARLTHSERSFRALYLGEFLDTGGSVFRTVRECAIGALSPPEHGHRYVGGLDLARVGDWTVAVVIDLNTNSVVAFERWHGVAWEETSRRVFELSKRYYGARFWVDSTGIGDSPLEMIERDGTPVQGVKFSATSKVQLIEHLVVVMERGELFFPPILQLMNELESFEGVTGPSGTTKYSGPSGEFDDCVIGLALAAQGMASEGIPLTMDQISFGASDTSSGFGDSRKPGWGSPPTAPLRHSPWD